MDTNNMKYKGKKDNRK